MATLTYVGRAPDTDSTLVPKSYADAQQASLAVTTTVVNQLIATAAQNLTTKSYADAEDALLAHKTDVTAADNSYLAATALGVASGVASLDSSGNLTAAQLPASGLFTDRVATAYSVAQPSTGLPVLGGTLSTVTGAVGSVLLGVGASHTVTTTTVREFQMASLVIPDPGYPWRPLPFAWVQGNSSGGTNPGTRLSGNGDYGLITCCPPSGVSNTVYGVGVCTASFVTDTYLLTPYAGANQTPLSAPPITGGLELDLFGSCWSGTSYTFYGTNLVYFCLVVPSL